jgi:hypothetical protein
MLAIWPNMLAMWANMLAIRPNMLAIRPNMLAIPRTMDATRPLLDRWLTCEELQLMDQGRPGLYAEYLPSVNAKKFCASHKPSAPKRHKFS